MPAKLRKSRSRNNNNRPASKQSRKRKTPKGKGKARKTTRRRVKRGGVDEAASGCDVFTKEFMKKNGILFDKESSGESHPVLNLEQFRTELREEGCEDTDTVKENLRQVLKGILEDTVPSEYSERRWAQPEDIANDIIDVLFYPDYFTQSEDFKTTIYNHLDELYPEKQDTTVKDNKAIEYLKNETRPYPLESPPTRKDATFEQISIKVRNLNQDLAIITGKWFLNFCEYIKGFRLHDVSVPNSSDFYAEEILKLYKKENGITIDE